GLGALQRMEDILAVPLEQDTTTVAARVPTRNAIEFDGVSFGYDGGTQILHDVSFAVPYGTRTALVGPSGAGKSTILQLVERFYDATAGAVRVGGHDVRDQRRADLRRHLGYVEQEAPVLAGTLRENLQLTVPE